jgi:hypothetical protein
MHKFIKGQRVRALQAPSDMGPDDEMRQGRVGELGTVTDVEGSSFAAHVVFDESEVWNVFYADEVGQAIEIVANIPRDTRAGKRLSLEELFGVAGKGGWKYMYYLDGGYYRYGVHNERGHVLDVASFDAYPYNEDESVPIEERDLSAFAHVELLVRAINALPEVYKALTLVREDYDNQEALAYVNRALDILDGGTGLAGAGVTTWTDVAGDALRAARLAEGYTAARYITTEEGSGEDLQGIAFMDTLNREIFIVYQSADFYVIRDVEEDSEIPSSDPRRAIEEVICRLIKREIRNVLWP